jgi:rhodanese-related sulfurtransferase
MAGMVQPIPAEVPEVTADSLGDDIYLLDVREPDEWAAGHAPHAHHIPMREIPGRLAEVPTVGDVVVVCRVGGRSYQVAAYLAAQGWENVANLDGGMLSWEAAGRPIVADTGAPARVI